MRRFLYTLLLCLWSTCALAFTPNIYSSGDEAVSADCPTWCGNHPVCWDGSYNGGTTDADRADACVNGAHVEGDQNGGSFSGSGASTEYLFTTANQNVIWSCDNTCIDFDAASGYTMCVKIRCDTLTANRMVAEFSSGTNANIVYLRLQSDDTADSVIRTNSANYILGGTQTITDDNVTQHDFCVSWLHDRATADHAVGEAVTGNPLVWTEDEDNYATFSVAENRIMIGEADAGGGGNDCAIDAFVVMTGWEQSVPW